MASGSGLIGPSHRDACLLDTIDTPCVPRNTKVTLREPQLEPNRRAQRMIVPIQGSRRRKYPEEFLQTIDNTTRMSMEPYDLLAKYWQWTGRKLAERFASNELQYLPRNEAWVGDNAQVSAQHLYSHIHNVVDRVLAKAFPGYKYHQLEVDWKQAAWLQGRTRSLAEKERLDVSYYQPTAAQKKRQEEAELENLKDKEYGSLFLQRMKGLEHRVHDLQVMNEYLSAKPSEPRMDRAIVLPKEAGSAAPDTITIENGATQQDNTKVRVVACGVAKKVGIVADAIPGFKQGFHEPSSDSPARRWRVLDPMLTGEGTRFGNSASNLLQKMQLDCKAAQTQFSLVEDGTAAVFVKFDSVPEEWRNGRECEVASVEFAKQKSNEVLCTYIGFYCEAILEAIAKAW